MSEVHDHTGQYVNPELFEKEVWIGPPPWKGLLPAWFWVFVGWMLGIATALAMTGLFGCPA